MRRDPDRVRANTAPDVLDKIDHQIEASIRFYATQPKGLISARIQELEHEWDIERYLQMNGSALALSGLVLGVTLGKRWLLLSAGVLGFMFQHATQGWCPAIPILRRAGFRTRSEIDREKYALKALRGDFEQVPPPTDANQLARAYDAMRAAAS